MCASSPGLQVLGRGADRSGDDDFGIPIGLLYSLTGNLAITETSIHQGALLAVDEVNAAGGVKGGRPLVPHTGDCASDCATAAAEARKLTYQDGVAACIGGYTSASRVAMQPAIHASRSLLLYTTYFEGLETDSRTFYVGAAPNHFLFDYVDWILANLGRRLYIVGSDYVYPRTLAAIICSLAHSAGAVVTAARYVPLGETDFGPVMDEIATVQPDVVISNIVGTDSTSAFYRQFRRAGYTASTLPIAATVTSELDLHEMGPENGAGHFMAATYFSSLKNAQNQRYVQAIRSRFGQGATTHVAQVGAYNAVWMLALAVERAYDFSTRALRETLIGTTFDGNPEGWPLTTYPNHYTDHPSYIGRACPDGEFDVLAQYPARSPNPYPPAIFRSASEPQIDIA